MLAAEDEPYESPADVLMDMRMTKPPVVVSLSNEGLYYMHITDDEKGALKENSAQTVYDPEDPSRCHWYYMRAMCTPFLLTDVKKVLMLGLGGGALVHIFHRLNPALELTAVEIMPEVVSLAQSHFDMGDYEFNMVINDAEDFVINCQEQFDLIVFDAYDSTDDVLPLTNLPLFEKLKNMLRTNGVLAVNVVYREKYFRQIMENVFDTTITMYNHQAKRDNIIMLGREESETYLISDLYDRADELNNLLITDLDFRELVDNILEDNKHTNLRITT